MSDIKKIPDFQTRIFAYLIGWIDVHTELKNQYQYAHTPNPSQILHSRVYYSLKILPPKKWTKQIKGYYKASRKNKAAYSSELN